jgi:hypothetical protein
MVLVRALQAPVLPRELSDEMGAALTALVVPVLGGPPQAFSWQLLMGVRVPVQG